MRRRPALQVAAGLGLLGLGWRAPRAQRVPDIRRFGASTANTAAQNTAAFQAAIAANLGGSLRIPRGTFLVQTSGSTVAPVGDALTVTGPITLIFEGIVKGANHCNVFHVNAGPQDQVRFLYEGGGVQGFGGFFERDNYNGALIKVSAGVPRIHQIKLIDPPQYGVFAQAVSEGRIAEAQFIGGPAAYPGDNHYHVMLANASTGWNITGCRTLRNAAGGMASQAVASFPFLGRGNADRTQVLDNRFFAQWEKGAYLHGDDCRLIRNWVLGNPDGEGLRTVGKRPRYEANRIKGCQSGGITAYDGEGALVRNNGITAYRGAGITLAYQTAEVRGKSLSRATIEANRLEGERAGANLVAAIDIRGDASAANVEEGIVVRGNEIDTANWSTTDERAGVDIFPGSAATVLRHLVVERNTVKDSGSHAFRFRAGTYHDASVRGNKAINPGRQHAALGGARSGFVWDADVRWTGQDIRGNEARDDVGGGMKHGFESAAGADIRSTLVRDNRSRGHVRGHAG